MVKEFFQRLFKAAEPQTKSIRVLKTQELGTTGTESYSGYSNEEYLFDLKDYKTRALVYDKMRRGDPQIKMCLGAVKAPIKAAPWEIEPYDVNDPDYVADAELMEYILFEGMDRGWSSYLSEALTMLDFGSSVFEMTDCIKQHPTFGPVNALKNLSFRSQKTLESWHLDPETQKLSHICQYAYGDIGRTVDIPGEFLLINTLEKEGSDYEGISALRACFGPWARKNFNLKTNQIGIEKFAVPTPIVTVPDGKESGEQFDNMIAALEAWCVHEKGYLTKPEGWTIEFNNNTYDPQKVEISIDNEDKRIAKAFIANFLELGMNGFGSQSLSVDLSDFFTNSCEQVAQIIADQINDVVIPRMIQLNRGPRAYYPKLKVSGISDRAGKELAEVLKILFDSKVVTPDDELEKYIRERYDLPEMSAIGQRKADVSSFKPQFSDKIRMLIRG